MDERYPDYIGPIKVKGKGGSYPEEYTLHLSKIDNRSYISGSGVVGQSMISALYSFDGPLADPPNPFGSQNVGFTMNSQVPANRTEGICHPVLIAVLRLLVTKLENKGWLPPFGIGYPLKEDVVVDGNKIWFDGTKPPRGAGAACRLLDQNTFSGTNIGTGIFFL